MNKKYERYINYIVNDIELPYIKYLNMYGLSDNECELVLSKVYDQPITINSKSIDDHNGNRIYHETSTGYWYKYEYDTNGNIIYSEDSDGSWYKREYDQYGKLIYYENSYGYIIDKR
jgi:YD repeat-containing protein